MKKQFETASEDLVRYLKKYLRSEFLAWFNVVRYYGILLPILLVGIIVLIVKSSPFPPKEAYLAIGQAGSSYEATARQFQDVFARLGLKLILVETEGLEQGLHQLNADQSPVNASFYIAGSSSAEKYPNLQSLGSFQYSPIWIFYRGEAVNSNDPFEHFAAKRFAIGLKETTTNRIFHKLYKLNHEATDLTPNLLELPHLEAAEQLQAGKIDAMFFVDSMDSPTVQKLLADKSIKFMSFNLAEAYAKKLDYLQILRIPIGSLDIATVYPAQDAQIISSTANLLIEKSLHPAIQWAFIMAAREVNKGKTTFFSEPSFFPRDLDSGFPLSAVASRYYDQGMPQVFKYLPLWLGSIIDNVWVLILGLVAVVYPVYKMIAGFRTFPSKKAMTDIFYDLRDLDEQLMLAKTKAELEYIAQRLDYYDALNVSTWLSAAEVRFYFNIKSQIANLKKVVSTRLEALTS